VRAQSDRLRTIHGLALVLARLPGPRAVSCRVRSVAGKSLTDCRIRGGARECGALWHILFNALAAQTSDACQLRRGTPCSGPSGTARGAPGGTGAAARSARAGALWFGSISPDGAALEPWPKSYDTPLPAQLLGQGRGCEAARLGFPGPRSDFGIQAAGRLAGRPPLCWPREMAVQRAPSQPPGRGSCTPRVRGATARRAGPEPPG